jgi:hypothetical protein
MTLLKMCLFYLNIKCSTCMFVIAFCCGKSSLTNTISKEVTLVNI